MTGNDLATGVTIWYLLVGISNLIAIIICGVLAGNKGRSIGGWIAGGFLLGWIGVIILFFLSDLNYYRPQSSWNPRGSFYNTNNSNNSNNSNASTNSFDKPKTTSYTIKKVAKYQCPQCGEIIDTQQCPWCGHRS